MASKSRGAPHPLGSDPNDAAGWLDQLAGWVNDRPGVAALTTTQRNALTGVDRWDGKLVLDTTLDRLFRWDAGTTTWIQIADASEVAALLNSSAANIARSPAMAGSAGVSALAAKADHVHPFPNTEAITVGAGAIVLGSLVSTTGDAVYAYRRGGTVTLEVYVVAGGSLSDVLTMPVGWRSPGAIRGVMNLSSTTGVRAVLMNSTGVLAVEGGMTNTQTLYGHMTYVAATV